MVDRRDNKGYGINLDGAQVIIANYYCSATFTDCLTREAMLEQLFTTAFQADAAKVLLPAETDAETLLQLITGGQ
jgi:hypothetical protein